MNGKRALAWRNLMTAAIDVALERRLIDLEPGPVEAGVFPFVFDGLEAIAAISDAGRDEVAVRVAVLPTECGVELVRYFGCGFRCGDCYASGWLERSSPPGPWLQTGRSAAMFRCLRELLATGAGAAIEPLGYVDHGRADVMAIRPGR